MPYPKNLENGIFKFWNAICDQRPDPSETGEKIEWEDIKNLPFGTKTEIVEILAEQSLTNKVGYDNNYAVKLELTLKANSKYKVHFNGKEYDVETNRDGGFGSTKFTDLPFSKNNTYFYWKAELGETITIAIYEEKEIVTPLPAKFMPEPIVFTTADMQTVTCNKTFDECLEAVKNYCMPVLQMGVTNANEYYTFSQISYEDNGNSSYVRCSLIVSGTAVIVDWSKFSGLLEISVTTPE